MPGGFGARTSRCARTRLALFAATAVTVVVGGAGCAEAGPRRHEIAIRNFVYEPAALTVAVGDTVVWTNEDALPHTATATDKAWDTGSIGSKESRTVVISQKGEQSYICTLHPNMRADLTAQ
ncbi:MAG: cupredoxin family copper-binding protein [Gemmatimonadetes bacterium]|nr:cupredoxin family copper-binding protein [Gemmatimonadota bacterium]